MSSEPVLGDAELLVFLAQVVLLLALARGIGGLLRRAGTPALVGEIGVGLLLGPTLLGRIYPGAYLQLFPPDPVQVAMLETVAWIGVLFLLLETGLEVDLQTAWRQRGPALRIGLIGFAVPFAVAFGLSWALPERYLADADQRLTFALFLGTTMAVSAMVVIARVLHDLDLLKTDFGLLTLCAYAIDDVTSWVVFSLALGLATRASFALAEVSGLLAVVLAFTSFCLTLGRRLVDAALGTLGSRLPGQAGATLTLVSCVGLLTGAFTTLLGLTPLFGFFLAGIMAGESRALGERARYVISDLVHAIFVPLYFASIGLRTDFLAEFDLAMVAFVTVLSVALKFAGAWLGALGTPLSAEDRVSMGIAFTPSGVTGIILAAAARDAGILSAPVFVAIVISALVSSMGVAPWLQWSIRRRRALAAADFLARDAVLPALDAATREQVIHALSLAAAPAARSVHAGEVARAVLEREATMGTAVGDGAALPHARLRGLARPVLAFGRAAPGVEWDAPDGAPVDLVFLLLTPDPDQGAQLQLLASIGHALGDASFRAALRAATDASGLRAVLDGALRADRSPQSSSGLRP
jgi:Kef-type K+ transport system membrane component KefB